MATLQEAITLARTLLDNPVDIHDVQFLGHANDALDAIALVRPELFYAPCEITCITDATFQRFNAVDSIGLVDIYAIKGGNVVRKITRSELDALRPSWHSDAAAAAEHWVDLGQEFANGFLLHPKSPSGQILTGLYVKSPPEYAAGTQHLLSSAYTPMIADFIIAKHLSRPSLNDQARSQAAMASFYNGLGVSSKSNVARTA